MSGAKPLLSRAAESIFWACRYVERAENIARSIDVNLNLILDTPLSSGEQWSPLYQVTGDDADFLARYDEPSKQNVIQFLTFDPDYSNSIVNCLHLARENARSVREIISSEMWEHINQFYLMVQDAARSSKAMRSPHEFYREVRMASHLLEGLSYATMSHNEAWHFGRMGRMLERADRTSRILDVKYFILLPKVDYVGSPVDDIQWGAVLKSCSGFEMYRKRFGRIAPNKVVEFLLLDREFPRAALSCLMAASDSLHAITGSPPGSFQNASEQRLGQMRSELEWADVDQVIVGGLHEYLDSFQAKLNRVGSAINSNFFDLQAQSKSSQYQMQS